MANNVNQKVNALLDVLNSDEGISLLIQALGDSIREVRETAHWLLTETQSEAVNQALRFYPYAQMQLLHTITGCGRGTNYFAININRKVLLSNCHSELTGYALASINVWNLQTGELADTLYVTHEHMSTGQDGQIIVTSFQPFVTVHEDWEMKPQRWGHVLHEQPTDIASLAVSNDGSIVAGGRYQHDARSEFLGRIAVWDLHADQLIHLLEWKPTRHTSRPLPMMISPDASLMLSQDNDLRDHHRLWNLQTGELMRVFETSPNWFADAIANTSDGGCIVSGIRDKSVKVWDLNTDQVIYSFPDYHPVPRCSPTAMTPDGKVLAYCNDANEIVLWELEVNQRIRTLPENPSPIQAICLSSDRQWLVSYDAEQTITIYGLPDE
ncbi:WD40 repeat domain-containing protein [Pantanalinema rosaneae CENA516]|uniref:WD40 repeat domain-containing protein n=1 Tax=Pantanalinema rosaneae TaxID=1620701 RepID=UPI003D6F7075